MPHVVNEVDENSQFSMRLLNGLGKGLTGCLFDKPDRLLRPKGLKLRHHFSCVTHYTCNTLSSNKEMWTRPF